MIAEFEAEKMIEDLQEAIIRITAAADQAEKCGVKITGVSKKEVKVQKGITKLAMMLGVEVTREKFAAFDDMYRMEFKYHGVKFMQVGLINETDEWEWDQNHVEDD